MQCAISQKINLFFREVDRRFHPNAQLDQGVDERMDFGRKSALQRAQRSTRRGERPCIDEIRHRFGLREIELVVEVGSLSEFPRLGAPCTELQHAGDERLEHHPAAVAVKLQNVLAGVTVGCREIQHETGVEGRAIAIDERAQRCQTRRRQPSTHRGSNGGHAIARDPHDADSTSPGRGGDRNDGVSSVEMLLHRKSTETQG